MCTGSPIPASTPPSHQATRWIDRLWRRQMRVPPHQHKGHMESLTNAEVGDGRRILPTKLDRRTKPHRIGTRHSDEICLDPTYPRHDVAVVETQTQVHAHRYAPAHTFDDADHVHCFTADRHEVDEPYGSLIGVEFRFQHHRVAPVPAARRADWTGRSNQPASVFLSAKQRSEDGAGVKPGYAQPVDRAVAANQRCCLGVTDNRVILNGQRHSNLHDHPARASRTAFTSSRRRSSASWYSLRGTHRASVLQPRTVGLARTSGDLILSPVRVNASVRRTWVPGAQTAALVPDHVAGSNVPARDIGGHYADAGRSRVARGGRASCGVDLGYGIRSRILSHLRRHAARRGCPVG